MQHRHQAIKVIVNRHKKYFRLWEYKKYFGFFNRFPFHYIFVNFYIISVNFHVLTTQESYPPVGQPSLGVTFTHNIGLNLFITKVLHDNEKTYFVII